MVRCPSGSTSLASFNPSELARSVFAAVTARMMAFGFGDLLEHHLTDLLLDIPRLVSNRHFR